MIELALDNMLILVSSPSLLAELAEVINRQKFRVILDRSNTNPEQTLAALRRLVEIIDPPSLPAPVSRDPSDDAVLALAARAQVNLIVSGDTDLLTLGSYAGTPIIDPAQAVTRIRG